MYKEWQNGNKYEETIKQERKIMNDDIRYNVLKRDNFTCKLCGISAKDGAKLHVDHIIPVSKGGKLSWVIFKPYVIDVIWVKVIKWKIIVRKIIWSVQIVEVN